MSKKTKTNLISKREFLKSVTIFFALLATGSFGSLIRMLTDKDSAKSNISTSGFGSGSYGS
jgi:hypothetical protein